jgi:hypothetical protein
MADKNMTQADGCIVDEGLLMAQIGRLLVVRFDERLTPRGFARYRTEWLRAVDSRAKDARIGAFYDIPAWIGITAKERGEWAAMLKSRAVVLKATTASMTLTTPSALIRGALRAIFWLAPPPYPHTVVERQSDAFAFHASHVPGLDPRATQREYDALVRAHAPRLAARG